MINSHTFLIGILTGILTSSTTTLLAIGLTLIFGVMKIVNIAHGAFVILSAYLLYVLEDTFHINIFLGLCFVVPAMFLVGYGTYWGFLRSTSRRGHTMLALLVLYAIAKVIEGATTVLFSATRVRLAFSGSEQTFPIFGFALPSIYALFFLCSAVLVVLLYMLVYFTHFGYEMRATMQNPTAAHSIGINVPKIAATTFGLGTALAGIGGLAFGTTNAFTPASADSLVTRTLLVVVVGGLGNMTGALVGSLCLGVLSTLTTLLWTGTWPDVVYLLLLLVLLLTRSQPGRRA